MRRRSCRLRRSAVKDNPAELFRTIDDDRRQHSEHQRLEQLLSDGLNADGAAEPTG